MKQLPQALTGEGVFSLMTQLNQAGATCLFSDKHGDTAKVLSMESLRDAGDAIHAVAAASREREEPPNANP